MTYNVKTLGLLFLAGALVLIILLAASLSNLQLDSDDPFPGGVDSGNAIQFSKMLPLAKTYSFPMLEGLLALLLIAATVYLLIRMALFVNIKTVIRLTAVIAIILTLLYLMHFITRSQSTLIPGTVSEFIAPPADRFSTAPIGGPPKALIWLVIIATAVGVSIPAFKLLKKRLGTHQIKDILLKEAKDAVNALYTGVDLRNVIMRCYMQMTYALQEEQGIERNYTMTVREFEDWLVSLGFPAVPVHQLTTLFEKVRYGEGQMSKNDEKIAVESLNQIIGFCRKVSV